MKCPACSNENPEGALFCSYCKEVFRSLRPLPERRDAIPAGGPALRGQQAQRAPDTEQKSVGFRIAIWRDPGTMRIERHVSPAGKFACGAVIFWGSLFLLGSLRSFSLFGILGSAVVVGIAVAIFRMRLGVVLDATLRQARTYSGNASQSSADPKSIGTEAEVTLADRSIGSSRGFAALVSRMILGSKVFLVHIEGAAGKIPLCELSNQREAVELAREVAKLFQIKVRDEGDWYVNQR